MSYKKSKFGPNSAKPVPAALPGGLSNRTQTHHSESLMHHHISLHTKLSNLIIIHSLLSSPSQYSLLPALHSTCCFCACAFFDPVLIPTRLSLLRVAASATNLQILINQSIRSLHFYTQLFITCWIWLFSTSSTSSSSSSSSSECYSFWFLFVKMCDICDSPFLFRLSYSSRKSS